MTAISAPSNGVTLSNYGGAYFTITNTAVVSYNATGPGVYAGYGAVYGDGSQAWTIVNDGIIAGTGSANGILLASGYLDTKDTITNQGTISSAAYGIRVYNSSGAAVTYIVNMSGATIQGTGASGGILLATVGTVTNAGSIIGGASGSAYAVKLELGGSLDNTGLIQGHSGVYLGHAGTVTNEAAITASAGYGIRLFSGGVVVNTGTIQGTGGGIYVGAGTASTITNAGTIDGGVSNDAVNFAAGNTSSKLIVDPGSSYTGAIYGGGGTIELAAGDPATLGGFGVNITNFATLQFDANANWTVSGAYATFGVNTAIAGFDTVAGNTIDLTGFVASTETYSTNALVLGDGDGNHVTLDIQGALAFEHTFQITTANTNTYIAECFASGTHIAALNGAVPIDDLGTGDLVNAHFAGLARVEWIGRRDVDCTRHPEPRKVWPVRVTAGTFGPSQPSRDLTLSPNHAVYVNGDLIPISCLINGTSIVQIPVDEVTYFHIELAQHDLLLAEGLLAESYLDVGDRANFINGGDQLRLFPDFATTSPDVAAAWETRGCAPLIIHGPRLEAVRSWLNGMAADVPLAVAA